MHVKMGGVEVIGPQKCCWHQHIRTTAIDDWLQNGHVLPQNWPHRNSYAGDFSLEKEM